MEKNHTNLVTLSVAVTVLSVGALCSCGTDELAAEPSEEYSLVVYDPSGATEISELHAERISDLNGSTVCLLSDFMWEADRTMPRIESNLTESHPEATIVPPEDLPDAYRVDVDELESAMDEQGCDAVIVGNGA